MPKHIDHEARQRVIARAVCALATERGVEGVSLRDVASRAEVSMGAVQRCFRTRDEMLVFALSYVGERVTDRARERLASTDGQPAHARLARLATEVALLDEEHRSEAGVWLAFVAQAAVNPELAAVVRQSYAEIERLFVRLIRELEPRRPAPKAEARALLALVDGLTTHVLIGRLTARAAREVLNRHLERLRT